MNKKVLRLIWINHFRLLKGTLRHSWRFLAAFALMLAVTVSEMLAGNSLIRPGVPIEEPYRRYAMLALLAGGCLRVLLAPVQAPVLMIDGASVLHAYHTPAFRAVLRAQWGLRIVKTAFWSLAISLFLNGLLPSGEMASLAGELLLYFAGTSMFSWIAYHGGRKEYACAAAGQALLSLLLAAPRIASLAGMAAADLALCLLVRKTELNIPKYYEKLCMNDAASAAFGRNDLAMSRQLAEQNRPAYVRGPTFEGLHPGKKQALFIKSMLEIVRTQKALLIVMTAMIVIGWLLARTRVFAFLPFFELSVAREMFGAMCIAMILNAFYRLLADQLKQTCDKRLQGLSLPCSTRQIHLSYAAAAWSCNLLILAVLGLVFGAGWLKTLLLWLITDISYLLISSMIVYGWKGQQVFTLISSMLLITGTYLCLISA